MFQLMALLLAFSPINSLDRGTEEAIVVSEKRYIEFDQTEQRQYRDVVLDLGVEEKARFTISLPKNVPEEGLPCIFIIAGLETGRDSLKVIPNQGPYVLVAYEYDPVIKYVRKKVEISKLFQIRSSLLDIPARAVGSIKWIDKQPFVSKLPTSVVGFSFGAIFVPAIYHLAKKQHLPLGPGVIAYGGAGIYDIFYTIFPFPMWLRIPLARAAALSINALEPSHHLPHIDGPFLIINGTQDEMIPEKSIKKLQEETPEPKTIINLDTKHLMPQNQELINHLIKISKAWLKEKRK